MRQARSHPMAPTASSGGLAHEHRAARWRSSRSPRQVSLAGDSSGTRLQTHPHHCLRRPAECRPTVLAFVFASNSPSHCLAVPRAPGWGTNAGASICDCSGSGWHRSMCTVLPPKAAVRIQVRTSGGRTVKKALLAVAKSHRSVTLRDLKCEMRRETISQDEELCSNVIERRT